MPDLVCLHLIRLSRAVLTCFPVLLPDCIKDPFIAVGVVATRGLAILLPAATGGGTLLKPCPCQHSSSRQPLMLYQRRAAQTLLLFSRT